MKRRILIVDDEPDTLKTFSDLFESEGYEVTAAPSGEAALASVNGKRPDVILLDIMMPGRTGIEVAREFAKREEAKAIPIVLITALTSFIVGGLGQGYPDSIQSFIFKPCHSGTLLRVVEDALRHHN